MFQIVWGIDYQTVAPIIIRKVEVVDNGMGIDPSKKGVTLKLTKLEFRLQLKAEPQAQLINYQSLRCRQSTVNIEYNEASWSMCNRPIAQFETQAICFGDGDLVILEFCMIILANDTFIFMEF